MNPLINLAGIPGTIAPEATRIRWIRFGDRQDPLTGAVTRCYEALVADGRLVALLSQDLVPDGTPEGKRLWHLSVSHRDQHNRPDRVPSWDELKHAMYRLVQADVPMILIFPRRSTPADQYVDVNPTTLHLWESTEPVDQ